MRDLKDQLLRDLPTFLNSTEFAEKMDINGTLTLAQWDDSLQPLTATPEADPTGWGISTQNSILFILENITTVPLPGALLRVQGIPHTIIKVTPELGILRLELERLTA